MSIKESILRPVKRIHGGAILPHRKNTENCETEIMPAPEKVYIPLSQHIGAPAVPSVKKGDTVKCGDVIASPKEGALGVAIHSSIDGKVKEITDKYITITR